jgi:hypothetical protein
VAGSADGFVYPKFRGNSYVLTNRELTIDNGVAATEDRLSAYKVDGDKNAVAI